MNFEQKNLKCRKTKKILKIPQKRISIPCRPFSLAHSLHPTAFNIALHIRSRALSAYTILLLLRYLFYVTRHRSRHQIHFLSFPPHRSRHNNFINHLQHDDDDHSIKKDFLTLFLCALSKLFGRRLVLRLK